MYSCSVIDECFELLLLDVERGERSNFIKLSTAESAPPFGLEMKDKSSSVPYDVYLVEERRVASAMAVRVVNLRFVEDG